MKEALPVWPTNRENEMNMTVGLRAAITCEAGERVQLRVAGASVYRCFVNGRFVGNGPAVSAHGTYRVDEWELSDGIRPGLNIVAVEVAGYNVNSYFTLDQPSFVQAEVEVGGVVAAATGSERVPSFEAALLPERVQRYPRYSFQRAFAEAYRLSPGYDGWRSDLSAAFAATACCVQPAKRLLPRKLAYAAYPLSGPGRAIACGEAEAGADAAPLWKDRSLTDIGDTLKGYKEEELEWNPSLELQRLVSFVRAGSGEAVSEGSPLRLKRTAGASSAPSAPFTIVDLGRNVSGFIRWKAECRSRARLYISFDEVLADDGDVDFKRLNGYNLLAFELEPGSYEFQSMEPYTLRYAKCLAAEGEVILSRIDVMEYVNAEADAAAFTSDDERINRIFEAGRETFKQNAVDNFIDCPSRERAGWLCDSFFTARTALDLHGHTRLEDQFLENYALPDRYPGMPDGMFPMCYPADHPNGEYIPNWALWLVLQLAEYAARGGDGRIVEALRTKVEGLFRLLGGYRNEDGLLERLDSWVFIEWSKANDFVQDVNYPTNMLYAAALDAAGRLYGNAEWSGDAARVRDTVRRQSYREDDGFFADHAVRRNGRLEVEKDYSEVCQYYAFYFGVAAPDTYPELWSRLAEQFGPRRDSSRTFPHVYPANAFIGNYLRLELLSSSGLTGKLTEEAVDYLLYMADRTGTLWENDGAYASCCHGFASHIVHVFYRDLLGLYEVNHTTGAVAIRFTDTGLRRCSGRIPAKDGTIALDWFVRDGVLHYACEVPAGYRYDVTNLTPFAIEREESAD